jgi:transposase
MDLTEHQWKAIEPLIPKLPRRKDGRGRPWAESCSLLNGILWILRTGAPWKDLPGRYGSYQTCHRRFQRWVRDGTILKILKAIAKDLQQHGQLDLSEAYIDGSFSSAKKGVLSWGKQSEEKAPKSWQLQSAMVFLSPLGLKALVHMK